MAAPGVLSNDADPNTNLLSAVLAIGPAHGTLTLNADGSFTYTPVPGYSGADSFTYKASDGILESNVATVSLQVVQDAIFADGFESGDLSKWLGVNAIDGGHLSVSSTAALVGSSGLQAVINDNNNLYVTDNNPNAESSYRMRFYFDPNSISMVNGNYHTIFYAYDGAGNIVARIYFGYNQSYQLYAGALGDAGTWVNTSWLNISDAAHYIEMEWRASTAGGANNGVLNLWVDGVLKGALAGIDNDTKRIEMVRLGGVTGIDTGTRGSYYFDAFVSGRQLYIGPVVKADFSASPTTGSAPLSVSFTSQSTPAGEITSYLWEFGDGGTSAIANPVHTYTTSGNYTVKLTVTRNGEADTFTKTAYIHVSDLIFADDFETGNLDKWGASVPSGNPSVSTAAALTGEKGMQVAIT